MSVDATRGRLARSRSIAVLATAGLLLVGCSNEPVGEPEPAPAPTSEPAPSSSAAPTSSAAPSSAAGDVDPAALQWTSTVCTALTPLVQRVQNPPVPDLSDSAATQQAFSTYLADAAGEAEQAGTDIEAAGAPPVQNADEISTAVSTQVEDLNTDLTDARARIDAVDPANPIAVGRAAVGAGADVIGSLGEVVEVSTIVADDPELGPAFEQSPECEPLRTITVPA